jgi:flavodoxin I
MKTLVVYDSVYGNTEKIAQAMGEAITGEVKVLRVGEVDIPGLETFDLLVVGSPTHGGRPTEAMRDFLHELPAAALKGTSVATFDTRLTSRFARIFGYAAGRIAGSLKKHGGTLMGSPEGFFVKGTEGPLKDGELERAAGWARQIAENRK